MTFNGIEFDLLTFLLLAVLLGAAFRAATIAVDLIWILIKAIWSNIRPAVRKS